MLNRYARGTFTRVFGPLARDRTVIAPDLPGFGDTVDVPVTGDPDDSSGCRD